MGNPFFNRFGNRGGGQMPGPFGNIQNMMSQFQQFKQNFQGDPQQQVQELLNSGKMTQEQFNQLSAMAHQFQGMFGGKG